MSRADALAAITSELVRESKERTGTTPKPHWFDTAAFLLAVGLIAAFVFVARQSFPHGRSEQIVVIVPGGISRYHVIQTGDVGLQSLATVTGSLGKMEDVLNHYAVEPLLANKKPILSQQLSFGTVKLEDLKDREVMRLPTGNASFAPADLPLSVTLYVSPKPTPLEKSPSALRLPNVYVLSAGQGWLAMALTHEDASKIAAVAANSEFEVAETVH